VSVLLRRCRGGGDPARLTPVRQDQDHDQHDDREQIAQNSEQNRVIALAIGDLRAGNSEHEGHGEDKNDEEDFDGSNLSSAGSAINVQKP
jgi:hypothetical protein